MRNIFFPVFVFCTVMLSAQTEKFSYTLLFDHNKSFLTPQSKTIQDSILSLLEDDFENYSVRVSGHTDTTGNHDYNERLSKTRTDAVMNSLLSDGFENDQISSSWYAYDKPVTKVNSEKGNSKNRRVDVEIVRNKPTEAIDLSAEKIDMELLTGLQLPREIKMMNPCVDNELKFNTGTTLTIPANSFKNAGCDELELVLTEMRDPIDFILSGIPMSVPGKDGFEHFNSAGMFRFEAKRSGETFDLARDAKIGFTFKASADPDSFGKFGFDNSTNVWQTLGAPATVANAQVVDANMHGIGGYTFQVANPLCPNGMIFMQLEETELETIFRQASQHIKQSKNEIVLTPSPSYGCNAFDGSPRYRMFTEKKKSERNRFYLSFINEKFIGKDDLSQVAFIVRGINLRKGSNEVFLDHLQFSRGSIKRKGTILIPANFQMKQRRKEGFEMMLRPGEWKRLSRNNSMEVSYEVPSTITDEQIKKANVQLRQARKYDRAYSRADDKAIGFGPTGNVALYVTLNFLASKLDTAISFGSPAGFDSFIGAINGDKNRFSSYFESVANDSALIDSLIDKLGRRQIPSSTFISGNDNVITGAMTGISIFNADQLMKMPQNEQLAAGYIGSDGKKIKMAMCYYMNSKINGVVRYEGYMGTPSNFTYSRKGQNSLILVDLNGGLYVIDRDTFAAEVAKDKNNAVFKVRKIEKGASKQQWRDALASN